MKPEDVKPVTAIEKLIGVSGLLPARNPDSSWSLEGVGEVVPCIPAHEVGAIIKAAMQAGYEAGEAWEADSEKISVKALKERARTHLAWLAKAEELEAMK